MDGTENQEGSITQYCDLWLQQGSKTVKSQFFVANLGRDRVILGYPRFKTFNPTIDWATNTLLGEPVTAKTAGHQTRKRCITRTVTQTINPSIPIYYHCHATIFDEEALHRFPPKREEDHAINLKEGAPPSLKCKVYPQTVAEEDATHAFINKHLEKGYIKESNSPYASPFFFRKKKDGKLQPITDYQVLNSWMIRDEYPLPLISTNLDHLQGKELFTKFDICWGYENIQIMESDQWKATFKTPLGLFQPRVMFFGLTNSPAMFCRTMARMFRHLCNKYPIELFVYMDDILIATKNDLTRHQEIVDAALDTLAKESYFLWPTKCIFEQQRIEYLGVIVDNASISIDPVKANGLRDWPCSVIT